MDSAPAAVAGDRLRCRICEELITASTLSEHSVKCARLAKANQSVRRVNRQLEQRCAELEQLLARLEEQQLNQEIQDH